MISKGHLWLVYFKGAKYGECHWCRTPLIHDQNATRDHVLPKSYGGSGDEVANLVISCAPCNYIRGCASDHVQKSHHFVRCFRSGSKGAWYPTIKKFKKFKRFIDDKITVFSPVEEIRKAYLSFCIEKTPFDKDQLREWINIFLEVEFAQGKSNEIHDNKRI